MTDNNNNNTTRSKLTLKLSPSVISNTNTTTNTLNDKKSSNSVQVTIKGRKTSQNQKNSANLHSRDLNKNELEARMKAISKDSSKFSREDIKTHEILSKINKENRQNEINAQEELVPI